MIKSENIILFSINYSCKNCKEIVLKEFVKQIISLNKENIFYHSGIKKYVSICCDVPIFSADTPEIAKLCYNCSCISNYGFCSKCYANKPQTIDFTYAYETDKKKKKI